MLHTDYELNGATMTAKPAGQLDSMTSPDFEAELRGKLSGVKSLVVDFEKVNYISSMGLRALLSLERFLDAHGANMKLIHVRGPIMEILVLVGFLNIITVE